MHIQGLDYISFLRDRSKQLWQYGPRPGPAAAPQGGETPEPKPDPKNEPPS